MFCSREHYSEILLAVSKSITSYNRHSARRVLSGYLHKHGVGEQAVSDDDQLLSHEEWHNLQDTQGHCDHPHLVTIRTKANSNDQFHLVGQSELGHVQHHQLLLDGGEHSQQPMQPIGFRYLL